MTKLTDNEPESETLTPSENESEEEIPALFDSAPKNNIKRSSGMGFWPVGCRFERPDYPLPAPDLLNTVNSKVQGVLFGNENFGHLSDETSYTEYAWEFLRRNLFYQRFIDKRELKSLDEWGYKPTIWDEAHAGVCRGRDSTMKCTLKYPDYRTRYNSDILWEPILWSQDLARMAILDTHNSSLCRESSNASHPRVKQFAFRLDIAADFGPGCLGLDTRLAIFKAELEQWLATYEDYVNPKKSNKATLRKMLAIADLLIHPSNPDDLATKHEWYTPDTLAVELDKLNKLYANKKGEEAPKGWRTSIHRLAKEAWAYIYQWQCLTLLTFDPPPLPPIAPPLPNKNKKRDYRLR